MEKFVNTAASLALLFMAGTPLCAVATAARAEPVRVEVGDLDLGRIEGLTALDLRLTQAAQRLCEDRARSGGLGPDIATCRTAVWREAFAQLDPGQRRALIATSERVELGALASR